MIYDGGANVLLSSAGESRETIFSVGELFVLILFEQDCNVWLFLFYRRVTLGRKAMSEPLVMATEEPRKSHELWRFFSDKPITLTELLEST